MGGGGGISLAPSAPWGSPCSPVAPVDLLDATFQAHDIASFQAQTNQDQALAERKLIGAISLVPDTAMSPEAHLYGRSGDSDDRADHRRRPSSRASAAGGPSRCRRTR